MATSTLKIVLENVDFRLPTQVTDDNSVLALKSLVFEPLVKWLPHGKVAPALFSSWQHSDDKRIWHFHIRDNAVFHDGKACDADLIVKYILGFLDSRDYFGMSWSYARYFAQTKFVAENARTVRVENAAPFADLVNVFTDFWPSRLAENGKPVLGTGPFEVTEFERPDGVGRAVLRRVDTSSKDATPQIIIATAERDGAKRLELLRQGTVDAALNLERTEDLSLIDFSDKSLNWRKVGSTLSVIYYLSCTKGVFASPEARLAANLAVDKEALVKEIYRGWGTPAATVVSPLHHGFPESQLQPIPYDPDAARKILQTHDTDTPIVIRTPVYMPEHAQRITAFVAEALEAVGFKTRIDLETNRPEYARSIGLKKNIGDIALFDSTPNCTFRVLDDKVSSESHNTWWMGYHDDAFQQLFSEAKKQIHAEDRAQAYAKALTRLHQNPPWVYIGHPDVIWATRTGLTLDVGPSGILTL
ncbi:hypothetical protein DV735_g5742, partial [Chaetothyriales sp. CBS 134920]